MADFCFDCTVDLFGEEYGHQNDFVHKGEAYWTLCEGCGIHLFRFNGKRACQRDQVEFHHGEGEAEFTPAWPDACPGCLEREND
jgi:hypothetical protein